MDKLTVIKKLARLQIVDNVKAAPPGATKPEIDSAQVQLLKESIPSSARADLRKLEEAGWTFGILDETPFDVVLDADGHLKISGQGMTVKFVPEMEKNDVQVMLAELSIKIRRKLGFSANTYLVEVQNGSALDIARVLNDRADVLYAEPNLIESLQSR